MKKLVIPICLTAMIGFGVSCGGGGSSDTANSDSAKTGQNGTANTTTATTTDTNRNNNESADTNKITINTNNNPDGDFILDAANGGLMEVQLGTTASTAATSPAVKEFGRMMVDDHTKANSELTAITSKKGITLPAAPIGKNKDHINDLTSKQGADFDKAYVSMMVDDHKEDVSKFQHEAKNGKDPDIKAFAAKTLPVLQKHLSSIQAIQKSMKKG